MDYEEYNAALQRARELHEAGNALTKRQMEIVFPELRESEDERICKWLVDYFTEIGENWIHRDFTCGQILAWLEKQKYDRMKPVYDNQDSFESALGKAWKDYNDSGARTVDGCEDNYVECAHAKGFREGYLFWLEKQKKQKPLDYPHIPGWKKNYDGNKPKLKQSVLMLTTNGVAEGEWLGEKWYQYRWSCELKDSAVLYWMHLSDLARLEKEDEWQEQKPEIELKQVTEEQLHNLNEAIKGLRMDGCERMADSLHSLYNILKTQEQKPNSTEDMPYIADERFYEREPADSFKYKLAEYMTKRCTKKEGPHGYSYSISSESILQMAKEELIKRGELKEQKPAEWNPEDEQNLNVCLSYIKDESLRSWLIDAIHVRYDKPAEWSEEDEKAINDACCFIEEYAGYIKGIDWKKSSIVDKLKSLRPGWKPSEEQLNALNFAITYFIHETNYKNPAELRDLYEQLKKL